MNVVDNWKCEICGQVVEFKAHGGAKRPQTVYENCKLRDHYVGDECLAFRDLKAARELDQQ